MNKQIDRIIKAELALHPRATLQDLYKLFFQSYFGAEHALTDVDSAKKYFEKELDKIPILSDFSIQDISVNFPIYRVNLQVITQGLIAAKELFKAFLNSANTPIPTLKHDWIKIWCEIEEYLIPIIKPTHSEIIDLREIAISCNTVHHSQIYRDLYAPHYRIICGEFLPEKLKSRTWVVANEMSVTWKL